MKKISFLFPVLFSSLLLHAQIPVIKLDTIASGFSRSVDIKNCGDDRLFIVEKAGRIKIMNKTGVVNATPFLNITSRIVTPLGNEQGLLGLAFSPNYKQDGFFYVNYITGTGNGSTRISRFSVNPTDSNLANPNSEVILLTFAQPATNHNGGNMMFGPDGYLYVGQGDGGSGHDPWGTIGNGQNLNTYHGKMLRLDVTNQVTYEVPLSNPFVGVPNTIPEIWSYGLRNPWRCSFDRITGDMWIGDVGQNYYEEIDFQDATSTGGENYGWRCREGLQACITCNLSSCTGVGYTDPVFDYHHNSFNSCSVTGGYVYRGAQFAALWGRYLFTDYCSGRFWSVKQISPGVFDPDTLQDFVNNQFTSFGEDNNGEMYLSGDGNGLIYHITESLDCNPVAFISFKDTIEGCHPITVSALYGDTLTYQWYGVNGVINGETAYRFTPQQSGWYKVKVSKTLYPGCEAMSDSVYINIYDTTAVTVTNLSIVTCVNSANLSLNPNISPTGGIFSGTGVSGNNFVPSAGTVGNNPIAYQYTNLHGCVSRAGFNVVLSDTTVLSPNSTDTVVCITEPTFVLTGYTNPVGGSFSGNGVTGSSFSPSVAGVGVSAITYAYTNLAGCESIYRFNLTVGSETTLVENVTDSSYCLTETAVTLAGFVNPIGGMYSGNGVTGSSFNASVAGIGTSLITYTYLNFSGCESRDSFNLIVGDKTILTQNITDSIYCNNENPISLSGFMDPTGGTFTGNGVNGNNFDPTAAVIGYNKVVYEYINNFDCESTDSFTLRVDNCTSVHEVMNEMQFNIFPNPGTGVFNVSMNAYKAQDAELIISDLSGKSCFRKPFSVNSGHLSITVDLSELPKGVYSVLLKTKDGSAKRSLVIE